MEEILVLPSSLADHVTLMDVQCGEPGHPARNSVEEGRESEVEPVEASLAVTIQWREVNAIPHLAEVHLLLHLWSPLLRLTGVHGVLWSSVQNIPGPTVSG